MTDQAKDALDLHDILPQSLVAGCRNMQLVVEPDKPFPGWKIFWAMKAPGQPAWCVGIGPEIPFMDLQVDKKNKSYKVTNFFSGYVDEQDEHKPT